MDDKSHYTPAQRRILEEKLKYYRDLNAFLAGQNKPRPPDVQYADERYRALSKKLRDIYAEACSDLEAKQASFNAAHEARVKKYRKQVAEGIITEADFQTWMRGQIYQGEQWTKKRQQLANLMVNADKQAARMINRSTGDVFCESANYLEYEMEHEYGGDLTFGLFDQNTFEHLVMEDPQLLPRPRIDEGKDFAWYNRIMQNSVLQGILQGESLDDITLRIANETFEKSLSAMRRNARTAYTGAMSAGKKAAMLDAKRRGIQVKKMWDAILDGDTRDAHQALDGQEAEVEERFMSKLGPIDRPGDPTAKPANVYNCRCRLRYVHPKYPSQRHRLDEDGEDVGNMTYLEWKAYKAKKGAKA